MNLTFRTTPENLDIERIREIVVSTKFFYDHEVEVAVELIDERLKLGESTGYYFVFAEFARAPSKQVHAIYQTTHLLCLRQ